MFVVLNISISKNESKSQHYTMLETKKAGCAKYQYFKE